VGFCDKNHVKLGDSEEIYGTEVGDGYLWISMKFYEGVCQLVIYPSTFG
jgi:hypothetical protein